MQAERCGVGYCLWQLEKEGQGRPRQDKREIALDLVQHQPTLQTAVQEPDDGVAALHEP